MFGKRIILWAGVLSIAVAAEAVRSAPPAETSDATAQAEPRKPRGRLPNHFAKLGISPEQRERIYSIQAEYDERIDELLAQIESLRSERNAAVEQVLTPEQREQLARILAEQQAQRRARRAAAEQNSQ